MLTLKAQNICFAYKGQSPLFNDASFELITPIDRCSGSIVSVVGVSGCGKSTLLKLLAGIEIPQAGEIQLQPACTSVSYVPQEAVVFEHLSREENARYFQNLKAHHEHFQENLFQILLDRLKLRQTINSERPVSTMSGGERQRLTLLRAASIRPGLMLLDEPCSGLDVAVKREFLVMLRTVVDEFGLIVVYATHHRDEVFLTANQVLYVDRRSYEHAANLSLWKLDEFASRPPTLEAAQFASSAPLNILECNLAGGRVLTADSTETLGTCDAVGINPGRYQLVFPPELVQGCALPALNVTSHTFAGLYSFLRSGKDANLLLVGPKEAAQNRFVCLKGPVKFFDMSGTFVGLVELTEPQYITS